MAYTTDTIVTKFIQGSKLDGTMARKKGIVNLGIIVAGLNELAKVAIRVTRPAWPKIISVEAIFRL